MAGQGRTYKVVQWATGAMGRSCMRTVIDRPDMELVGLLVYSSAKVGKDAGDLVHRPATGVLATTSKDEILSLDADVVVHCARIQKDHTVHDEDILNLLASGKNVISINGNSFPPAWDKARRDAFELACAKGQSSFLGTGLNPGFIGEKLLSTASSVCTRVDSVAIHETVLAGMIKSPEYIFNILGFGSEPGAINLEDGSFAASITLNTMYEEVVASIAHQLGWSLDGVNRLHQMLPAKNDLEIAAGTIKAGQISHTDWRWRGVVGGEERIAMDISWAVDPEYTGEHPDLWQLDIKGEPDVSLRFNVERPVGMPGSTTAEQMAVGGMVGNAIAYVVAAAPGLLCGSQPMPYYLENH